MESRQFLESISSQFIETTVVVLNQCSIVNCDAVLRSTASTSLDLLLVTVFSELIRENYLDLGIYLIDVVLEFIVPNRSI